MSEAYESVLNAARQLPPSQLKLLAEQLFAEAQQLEDQASSEISARLDAVEKTRGTIKGLDRETIIQLAEDEEYCGY